MTAEIVQLSFTLVAVVSAFVERARTFFYQVMLSECRCPRCGGALAMEGEAKCQCQTCQHTFDPTAAFQRCPSCGGKPRLRVRHYECGSCASEVASRFLFDGLAFDTEYFRQKMAEHRQRKQERRERVRQMLAESRSGALCPPGVDLGEVPGLADALNALTAGIELPVTHHSRNRFDLKRYQAHIQAHIQPFAVSMEVIPPVSKDRRIDRIWRFIAIIFLAHAGIIDVWQDGQIIMVRQSETDRERPHVPGDLEAADGIEGPVGRVEA